MELFQRAKVVRLRSHHDKYLVAEEDEEHVTQDRSGAVRNARWTVEFVHGITDVLRLKSCYGKYLTASNEPFLLGVTGKKVLQTLPGRLDSSLEWEPVREGFQVKLKTRYGNYLRANGGLPPWRNSVTHDVPHRTATQDWILWDVDIVEIEHQKSTSASSAATAAAAAVAANSSSSGVKSTSDDAADSNRGLSASSSSRTSSPPSQRLSKLESSSSFSGPIHKVEGRSISYAIADDDGNVDFAIEWKHLTFIGTSMPELTDRLKEETGLDDILLCMRNPLNQSLIPLHLELPPSNTMMKLVVVDANSRVGKKFAG